jgi:hypothetical protein
MNGHSRCIEALVRLRVEIDVTNVDDRTPLHEAIMQPSMSIETMLILVSCLIMQCVPGCFERVWQLYYGFSEGSSTD